ncbi:MAG: GNAT family N-acetyltransferase [Pyrinomonadaceae bacterium]
MLEFRPLVNTDFPLMLEWLSREHVKEWWDDGDDTLEKVARHYGRSEEGLERFILLEVHNGDKKPIGYFQYYAFEDGSIGIDQFIGEETHINRGIGSAAVTAFVEIIKRRQDPPYILLDPHPANARAIRCYEKAGFEHYATEQDENGKTAFIMRIGRPW